MGWVRDRINERKIRGIHSCPVSRGSTGTEDLPVYAKRARTANRTQFFKIVLVDLDKLRLRSRPAWAVKDWLGQPGHRPYPNCLACCER